MAVFIIGLKKGYGGMKKILSLILSCSLAITLAGCASDEENFKSHTVTTEIPTTAPTVSPLSKTYGIKDKIPLILENGTKVGIVRLNQVEKLGIVDWKNSKAIDAGIGYSYSFNLSVKYNFPSANSSNVTLECFPEIVSGGAKLSSLCSVGWSGFSTKAELFSDNPSAVIEVGVQPEHTVPKNSVIQLRFKDSNGDKYQPVTVSRDVLVCAKKGPKIHYVDDIAKINSACGAKYGVTVKQVAFEPGRSSEDVDGLDTNYFQIQYGVNTYKKPTNSQIVKSISLYKRKMCLSSSVVFGLQPNNSSDLLYQASADALRQTYADSELYCQKYVSPTTMIPFNRKKLFWTNRNPGDDYIGSPTKVRISFEFPEELSVRNLKNKLKFNGRFTVFEIAVTDRKIPNLHY